MKTHLQRTKNLSCLSLKLIFISSFLFLVTACGSGGEPDSNVDSNDCVLGTSRLDNCSLGL